MNESGVSEPAYFEFVQFGAHGAERRFVFKLLCWQKIAEAREIIGKGDTLRVHVSGTIIKEKASYNPDWSFHLDPDSIGFFEISAEVCDANVEWVEDNLTEIGGAALPNSFWCPWSSKLVREREDLS